MNKNFIIILFSCIIIFSNFFVEIKAYQPIDIIQLPILKQDDHHRIVSQRIISRLIKSHYHQFDLNDKFSEKIFNRYIKMLDFGHNVLLKTDIDEYIKHKLNICELLKKGDLNMFYDLYNIAQKRRFEQFKYASKRLEIPINFNTHDFIEIDRFKSSWPKNKNEINELWDKKVKFDWLNLKLIGKSDIEIKEKLYKRYYFALKYLTQSKSEDVFQLIINSFTREIDPHTSYLSPNSTEQFNSEINLSLEGIGVVLQQDDEDIVISSLITGSPAAKSKKLKVGDKIIGVADTGKTVVDVIGWRIDDVINLIRGAKGSKVTMEIVSVNNKTKSHFVSIVREYVRLEDKAVKLIIKKCSANKIAILDIPSFYIGLTNDVKSKLQKLVNEDLSAIIIDLRGNGGGVLSEAVTLSGLFIRDGPIVQVRNNNGQIHQDVDDDGIIYYNGPLVVLVNRFSASASEIFAAAMQDYKRALIVGEQTFGKGTVQQHKSLNRIYDQILKPEWPPLGSIQYTIQKFYRITGESTQRKGVIPDIIMLSKQWSYEVGERFEDNSLPLDKISEVNFNKVKNIPDILSVILINHLKRINQENCKLFFINNDLKCFKVNKNNNNFISLNYELRKKENSKIEKEKLNYIYKYKLCNNKTMNFYEEYDPYLDEAINISIDLKKIFVM
ncbi:Tail-specific protease [Candidatus Providencia siddallii]|uniref:Tail-specific protease n=1 Tax=Candidatus Providencia siddallii TaxID=1715285 RepID=A0A0M6W7G5_9GAMM|nr:Tail-specific protease [Candidatus Providencia siddallii]